MDIPIVSILAFLTLAGGVLFFSLITIYLAAKYSKMNWAVSSAGWIKARSIPFAFTIALVATLGSLYFSEILDWEPCRLCWYQRIFMYPLTVIFLISMVFKEDIIHKYALALALIGAAFAGYHYYVQMNPPIAEVCSIDGGPSCGATPFTYYGYITIPMMALTAFGLIIAFVLPAAIYKRRPNGYNGPDK